VVQISAGQSFIATPFQIHACAAKAGVDMLTRVLALEWGGPRASASIPSRPARLPTPKD
jgi:NAD(P)-dependent dehydrogenase (short-subunit alcohol dehydrogenase family)